MGSDTGLIIAIGQRVTVRLDRGDAGYGRTWSWSCSPSTIRPCHEDADQPNGRATRRKAVSTKRKKDKIKRKVERKRRQR